MLILNFSMGKYNGVRKNKNRNKRHRAEGGASVRRVPRQVEGSRQKAQGLRFEVGGSKQKAQG